MGKIVWLDSTTVDTLGGSVFQGSGVKLCCQASQIGTAGVLQVFDSTD